MDHERSQPIGDEKGFATKREEPRASGFTWRLASRANFISTSFGFEGTVHSRGHIILPFWALDRSKPLRGGQSENQSRIEGDDLEQHAGS